MSGRTGGRRAAGAAGALVLLLAVVGLATRARTPVGGGPAHAPSSDVLFEYGLLLMLALAVLVIPVWVYMLAHAREEGADVLPARRNWMVSLLVTMIVFVLVAGVVLGGRYLRHHRPDRSTVERPLLDIAQRGSKAQGVVRFDWGPVIVVASLTAAGALAAGLVLVRRRRGGTTAEDVTHELAVALDRTIADLLAEPDPRRAVIAAYAQMESALARAGLRRRPPEAPREYLARVLPDVGAGAASIERLTALFERAKFSPHAIGVEMKNEAIAALQALRDELRSGH